MRFTLSLSEQIGHREDYEELYDMAEPTGQWEPTPQGVGDREEDWYQSVWWSHIAFCGCGDPGFHFALLAHRRRGPAPAPGGPPAPPEGPAPPLAQQPLPRFLPLPGLPPAPPEDPPAPRPGGGDRAGDGAGGGGGDRGGADGDWDPADVEALLEAAAEEDGGR